MFINSILNVHKTNLSSRNTEWTHFECVYTLGKKINLTITVKPC